MVYCSALDPFDFDADPGSTREKMNPDLGHFFKIYWFFARFFFTYFHSKTWWPIQKSGISLFSIVQIWGLRVKKVFLCSFWLILCPLDPDTWICIFLRILIWIQEAKILRIQRIRIRILTIVLLPSFLMHYWYLLMIMSSVTKNSLQNVNFLHLCNLKLNTFHVSHLNLLIKQNLKFVISKVYQESGCKDICN